MHGYPESSYRDMDETKTRYSYITEWFDSHAELYRSYEFFYYSSDATIEMVPTANEYDPKQRRTFLKRSKSLFTLPELAIGSSINVNARQLVIKDYADEFTRSKLQVKMEATLVVINPAALQRLGEILSYLNKLAAVRLQTIYLDQETVRAPSVFFEGLKAGKSIVVELVAENSYAIVNAMLGKPSSVKIEHTLNEALGSPQDIAHLSQASHALQLVGTQPDSTLCLIRPHAFIAGISGNIIQDIISAGFQVSRVSLVHLNYTNAEEFLEIYKSVVPEYQLMLNQLTTGPLVALEVCCENSVATFRDFVGPVDPELARRLCPGTLRAKYGVDKVKNAIHCTDLPEDGPLETDYFFKLL